ncbi:MAG: hypothetical protein MJZ19_09385 [Paludibacteraceae bacterium]|nr:hypothetical protein [Paludibacteraceae bacterium]
MVDNFIIKKCTPAYRVGEGGKMARNIILQKYGGWDEFFGYVSGHFAEVNLVEGDLVIADLSIKVKEVDDKAFQNIYINSIKKIV